MCTARPAKLVARWARNIDQNPASATDWSVNSSDAPRSRWLLITERP